MIVVSASMKKAGSGWYFNLTNDLIVAAGGADVRALRDRYGLHEVLQGGNCQVNRSRPLATSRVLLPLLRGETFTVKTHGRPVPAARALMAVGAMRATYIYRDPRDVVLSVLDHGTRLRAEGNRANVLAGLESVEAAARYVGDLIGIWEQWAACPHVLTVRYEDLVDRPRAELDRLAAFLQADVDAETLDAIVARYGPDAQSATARHNLHFNRGVVRRFETAMASDDLARCHRAFGPALSRMGYA